MKATIRLFIVLCFVLATPLALAQGTAFTYQGRLNNGTNVANGTYDLAFSLFSVSGGGGRVGPNVTNSAVAISNGLFSVTLDFGANFPGADRWLEIGVRTNGAGAFTTLTPRQKLTATPYAVTASNLTGTLPATQLTGTLASAQLGGTYTAAITLNNSGNSFSGNGAGLTGVNALTLAGYDYCSLPCYWKLTGNAGTTAGLNFLGTTDDEPLELKVNGQRAFRLEPNGTSPNVIGGASDNGATAGSVGVAIGGGKGNFVDNSFVTIAGGVSNLATGHSAFIAGGSNNTVAAAYSAIGGGTDNSIEHSAAHATISGGQLNSVELYALHASVGGGSANVARAGQYSTIGGGSGNIISAYDFLGSTSLGGTIGGGLSNYIRYSQAATIAGGEGNRIEKHGNGSTIAGGRQNRMYAQDSLQGGDSTISGGYLNEISVTVRSAVIAGGTGNRIAPYGYLDITPSATIGGGEGNFVTASYSTIAGGISNSATGRRAVIGGGTANTAHWEHSTVAGGFGNFAGSEFATVSGGRWNSISAPSDISPIACTIAGGSGNRILTGNMLDGLSDYSAISGGESNLISHETDHSLVGGGGGNAIGPWASYCSIGGGLLNSISGNGFGIRSYATIAGGYSNQISANGLAGFRGVTVGGGIENAASGYATTIPGGAYAKASNHGQMAYASGRFTSTGDAQTSTYVCRGTTTGNTLTELFLDGQFERMNVQLNATWGFEMLVAGRTATGISAAYRIHGTIKNVSGTTSLVAPPTFTRLGDDPATSSWDAIVSADDTSDALVIRVAGTTGVAVRWVASVRTVEVTF